MKKVIRIYIWFPQWTHKLIGRTSDIMAIPYPLGTVHYSDIVVGVGNDTAALAYAFDPMGSSGNNAVNAYSTYSVADYWHTVGVIIVKTQQ